MHGYFFKTIFFPKIFSHENLNKLAGNPLPRSLTPWQQNASLPILFLFAVEPDQWICSRIFRSEGHYKYIIKNSSVLCHDLRSGVNTWTLWRQCRCLTLFVVDNGNLSLSDLCMLQNEMYIQKVSFAIPWCHIRLERHCLCLL